MYGKIQREQRIKEGWDKAGNGGKDTEEERTRVRNEEKTWARLPPAQQPCSAIPAPLPRSWNAFSHQHHFVLPCFSLACFVLSPSKLLLGEVLILSRCSCLAILLFPALLLRVLQAGSAPSLSGQRPGSPENRQLFPVLKKSDLRLPLLCHGQSVLRTATSGDTQTPCPASPKAQKIPVG